MLNRKPLLLISNFLLLTVSIVLPAFSQQTWQRTYGGTNYDWGYSMQQTTDGGYIITGYTSSFGAGGYDVYLIKTNSQGDTLWTRTYGGTGDDRGFSVRQTTDGGYIIAGHDSSSSPGLYDVWLIKTNTSGDTLWTRTYGGADYDEGFSVQQTSDNGYIIAGRTFSFGGGYNDVYLVKTNATGDTLWTKTYGGLGDDCGNSVRQTSDGGYIIAGSTASYGAGRLDVYLIKTNAQGDTLWTRTYGGAEHDFGFSVQQTSDGYIIGGFTESFGAGNSDVWLIKTNAQGDTLWTKTYGGPRYDYGRSVQQTSDGGYVIAGFTDPIGGVYNDVFFIKTNASGDTLWTRTYGDLGDDWSNSVQQTSDGGYIIAGTTNSFGAGNDDVYLIKTDANGNVGVEESQNAERGTLNAELKINPNPFVSFATLPGHEAERFSLYDISGRRVGTYKGDRVGEGLSAGVYFLRPEGKDAKPLRVVKVR